jgi:hypothetical protein
MSDNAPWWFGLTPAELEEERRNTFAEDAYGEVDMEGQVPLENVGYTDEF